MRRPTSGEIRFWYGKAAEDGSFHDIESPMRQRKTGDSLWHKRGDPESAHYWGLAEAFLRDCDFETELDRRIWTVHVERQAGERIIAREIFGSTSGGSRRKVERVLTRLRDEMAGRGRKRRGRPRDPESLRSEAMGQSLMLSTRAALALDHIRAVLQVSRAEAIRKSLEDFARRIPSMTKLGGQR